MDQDNKRLQNELIAVQHSLNSSESTVKDLKSSMGDTPALLTESDSNAELTLRLGSISHSKRRSDPVNVTTFSRMQRELEEKTILV
jgi:hypothetical protein